MRSVLEQDAQNTERIPKDMSEKKINDIARRLKKFLLDREISQSEMAKKISVSPSVISQFLKGTYKGNLVDLTNKVVNFMNTMTRKERRVKGLGYVETSIAERIAWLITQTEAFSEEEEGKIGLVIGDGGHGKSKCLRQYAKNNQNTIYVELDQTMHATLIFAEIAQKLGIDSSGTLSTVTRRVIGALVNRQSIIMLDEAAHLTVRQLDQLRQIIVVKSRCPLILAGNRHLLNTVMQPPARRGFESLDQFTSRLMGILDLDMASTKKDGGLYTTSDIRKLFEYGGVKLSTDGIETLRRICRTPGSGRLRTCNHIVTAMHISKAIQELGHIDAERIIWAIGQLDLPVKVRLPMTVPTPDENNDQQQVQKKVG